MCSPVPTCFLRQAEATQTIGFLLNASLIRSAKRVPLPSIVVAVGVVIPQVAADVVQGGVAADEVPNRTGLRPNALPRIVGDKIAVNSSVVCALEKKPGGRKCARLQRLDGVTSYIVVAAAPRTYTCTE